MTTGSRNHGIDGHPFQGQAWRGLVQFAAEALAAGLLVSLVLALAIFIATTHAQASEPSSGPGIDARPADAGVAPTRER